jgi:transcriptional regulator with XRE-family HTH domain
MLLPTTLEDGGMKYARWSMKRYRATTNTGSFICSKAYAVGLGDIRALAKAAKISVPVLKYLCAGGTAAPATIAPLAAALELSVEDKVALMKLTHPGRAGMEAVEVMEIRKAVAKAGSQAELARRSGVRRASISEAIRGVRIPRPSTMRKIREAVAA